MHEHKSCKHSFKYCEECDVVYCEKCKGEWKRKPQIEWQTDTTSFETGTIPCTYTIS